MVYAKHGISSNCNSKMSEPSTSTCNCDVM